jgi:hypothetical protein
MKYANAIEGGIAGVTTLTLLEKALQNIDTKKPKMKLIGKPGIIKHLKKKSKKNRNNELFIDLAKELLAAGAYYGFIKLGKKGNALLRGGLLGAATGAGVALLENKKQKKAGGNRDKVDNNNRFEDQNELLKFWQENKEKILTVGLYTAGGVLAGAAIKKLKKKKKK